MAGSRRNDLTGQAQRMFQVRRDHREFRGSHQGIKDKLQPIQKAGNTQDLP